MTDRDGRPLRRYPLAVEQTFPPEPMYLLTFAMQGVVRDGDGDDTPPCRPAGQLFERDEQQQQRETGDHFRHHERCSGHGGEHRAPPERPKAHQREPRERTEDDGDGRGHGSDLQRQQRGVEDLFVREQLAVPGERR